MGNCVIYTRVSSAAQSEQGTSLAAQYAACLTKAQSIGATVVGSFSDVQSGADYADREGLQGALAEIEAGRADTLIIYDMSRYSRDLEHQQIIRKRVAACDGRLVFCTMDVGDLSSPESSLSFGVSGVFAEYERLKIRERTMSGRLRRAQSGLQVSRGQHPYGYHIVTRDDVIEGLYGKEQIGHYVIVEDEAVWVREIFERYSRGHSIRSICRYLTLEGPAPPKGGAQWGTSTIKRILGNPVYMGKATYGKLRRVVDERRLERGFDKVFTRPNSTHLSIEAPPIVSESVWQAAQAQAATNSALRGGRRKEARLLSGLLRCPLCDSRLTARYGGNQSLRVDGTKSDKREGRWIYACRSRFMSFKKESPCPGFRLNALEIEATVLKEFVRYIKPERYALYCRQRAKQVEKPQVSVRGIEKKLKELKAKESHLIEAQLRAIEAGVSSAAYEERLKVLCGERDVLQEKLKATQNPITDASVLRRAGQVADVAELVREAMRDEAITSLEKRDLLAQVIEKIIPDKSGQQVEIVFKS